MATPTKLFEHSDGFGLSVNNNNNIPAEQQVTNNGRVSRHRPLTNVLYSNCWPPARPPPGSRLLSRLPIAWPPDLFCCWACSRYQNCFVTSASPTAELLNYSLFGDWTPPKTSDGFSDPSRKQVITKKKKSPKKDFSPKCCSESSDRD